jgi:hypothetical protein
MESFVKFGKVGNDDGFMVVWIDELMIRLWVDDV